MSSRKKPNVSKDILSDVELVIEPKGSTEEVRNDTRKAFMGLALSNYATNDDLRRGPHLTMCSINSRPMTKKRRDDFIRAVGGDPQDLTKPLEELARSDPAHAIIVLVERKFVDQASLVKNPQDAEDLAHLCHIVWADKENFSISRGTVANGNGRIDICRTVLAPKLDEERQKVEQAIAKCPPRTVLATLRKQLEAVYAKLDSPATWITAFYDLDMINNSPHATQIKLSLATNTPIYQVPDSEDEALDLILNNISNLPKADRLDNLKSHAGVISSGPKRLAPVINNTPLILVVIDLYRYSKLWPGRGFCTNQLYDWRTGVSPFFEAMVKQGIALLDYLTSNIAPPLDNGVPAAPPPLCPRINLLDAKFFNIVSECYVKHLYPCRDGYGVPPGYLEEGKPLYTAAYDTYTIELIAGVVEWSAQQCNRLRDDEELAEDVSILETMPQRLAYALKHGLFNNTQFGLELCSKPPVLCKFFLIDFSEFLFNHRYAILEVFRMMEPLICSVLLESRSQTEFKDKPTEFLCSWIKRRESTAQPMVLSTIFSHRNTALLKMTALDLGISPRVPPRSSLYGKQGEDNNDDPDKPSPRWTGQYHMLVNIMKMWRTNQVEGTGSKVIEDYPQHRYFPTTQGNLLQLQEHGDLLLDMLYCTALHWAAFSASQITAHIKTIAGYMIHSLWVHFNHGRRYLATNEVWDLRHELDQYFNFELNDFNGFWDGVWIQVGGKKSPMTQTEGSIPRKLVLENVGKTMEGRTQAMVKSLAQQLVHRDLGAVPLHGGGLGLPDRVFRAANTLFKEIAVATWKARTMYTNVEMDRMAGTSKAQRENLFDALPIPDSFTSATATDVKTFYSSVTADDLKLIQASGKGSEREQAKITRAQIKIKKRIDKINRALGVSPAEVGLEHTLEDVKLEQMDEEETNDEEDYDDSVPGYIIKRVPGTPPLTQLTFEEGEEEEDEEEEEEEEEVEDNDDENDAGDKTGEDQDEEEEDEGDDEESIEEQSLVSKRKRRRASSSLEAERAPQRQRIDFSNSPDRRTQELMPEKEMEVTPVTQDGRATRPPDAPRAQKIGKPDNRTPESTFPSANPPAPRDSSPDYAFDGFDDRTLIEMASIADNTVVAPIHLFKDASKGKAGVSPWTSSPQAGPSSSTPPVSNQKRELRSRRK